MLQPIFIIGCPRSGTTIALEIMALQHQVAWVSNVVDFAPRLLHLSLLNRVYDLPFLGNRLYLARIHGTRLLPYRKRKYLPKPVESWRFWNSYLSNFQWERGGMISPRRRTPEDISPQEVRDIKDAVRSICRYHGRQRFLSKYTDFPRMRYLIQAFPDALFLHIIRDGRAVAASYHEKIEKSQFDTWNEREWWIKGWPTEWQHEWLKRYRTPLSFTAFQWKFFVSEIWKDAKEIPTEQYMEIRYREIVDSPRKTFDKVFAFCGLETGREMMWCLDRINLRDMNRKWKEKYSDTDKRMLDEIIHEPEFRAILD